MKPPGKVITCILSFIPGCGQMYLGLMKRGSFIMASFFACNYLAASLFHVFEFGSMLIWFYSFFDAYNCRKKIALGKEIDDDVEDIKRFLKKNRNVIVGAFGIVFIIEVLRNIRFGGGVQLFKVYIIENLLIFLLICLGLYIVFFRRK